MNKDKDKDKDKLVKLIKRAKFEDKHHSEFDYKQKHKLCLECGEKDGRHTYTCIYFDRDK